MLDVSLRERRQALLKRTDLQGTTFCRAYAQEADDWLSAVAERASGGNARQLALLAVGGYGRGELCPFSDLDILLAHGGHREVAAVADAIWYPVWDQGVHLDHSVRRRSEVLEAAAVDLRVALGMLDARLVWGDPKVAEPLIAEAQRRWVSRLGAQWTPDLEKQMIERRRAYGDVAFLLEPELKESHGGLRDVSVLRAVAAYAPLLNEYVELSALEPAAATLTAVRVELHRGAGRELDRLLLQEQDHIAAALEYEDADALMAAVSEAGRTIAWVADETWRRRRLWAPPRRGRRRLRFRSAPPRAERPSVGGELEPGLVPVGGEVALASGAAIAEDSSLAFRLAAVSAERDLPIARSAVHRLADKMPPPPDPWPDETREALERVLATGPRAIDALEAIDQQGLLVRLLPEWAAVRNRPQRNAYHTYTVDRHLLEAAANAAALTPRVERPDLLLVGTFLHDIGKGFAGDHTEVGKAKVREIATRMGFSPEDVETLVTMEALHLLLPDTATRRDLDDPATIERVAKAVGDRATLELLAALTEADSQATGPSAWGPWKAGLVSDLVQRVSHLLQGEPAPVGGGWVTEAHLGLMDEVRTTGAPVVVFDPPRVTVAAPDRRGLLSSVAGVLALHGLDVRSADVTGSEGVALEVFTVEVRRNRWPDAARLRQDLVEVLSGQLALDEHLAEKARVYAGEQRPSSARPVVPQVLVDNDASASSTVVEVRAADELGLLHRVTRALVACNLDVVSARVSTIGPEVIDAFYVRDALGHKVDDPGAMSRLQVTVRGAVA